MKIVVKNKRYRVVSVVATHTDYIPYCLKVYKVQIKLLCFWITIKTFSQEYYNYNEETCKFDAIRLYNELIRGYGKF